MRRSREPVDIPLALSDIKVVKDVLLTSMYVRLLRCTAATQRRSSKRTCHTPDKSVNKSRTHSPFRTFHILSVRSEPEMTFCPSCWKQVIAPVCALSVALQAPVSGSQMRSVLSAAAETRRSWLRSRRPTSEVWPSRLKRQAPVSRSHTLTRLSMLPEMQRLRAWSRTTEYTF
jgi:hypothetical protein